MATEIIQPVENQERLTKAGDAPPADSDRARHEPLFPAQEGENLRGRWHEIQGNFVDEPRQAVERADELVATVVARLVKSFADERARLEDGWAKGQDVSTEDLRQALQRYRSFFDRLLII
jgi:hypothetical protein